MPTILKIIWLPLILISSVYAEIRITGLDRTDEKWFLSYLNIQESEIPLLNLDILRRKILSTQLFTRVTIQRTKGEILEIDLEEKWTLIPVIRGAYGGGVPLSVIGFYDIHTLGRFYTFGIEMRQYASATPGGVAYFRIPSFDQGRKELASEFWHNNRIRNIYHLHDEPFEIRTSQQKSLLRLTQPISPAWRSGVILQHEIYRPSKSTQSHEDLNLIASTRSILSPMLLFSSNRLSYDNIFVDGYRVELRGGPTLDDQTYIRHQVDAFYYWRKGFFNLAFHANHSFISTDIYELGYFIGGFDSVRGLPDSYYFGHEKWVGNTEARYLFYKQRDYWLQSAVFLDLAACRQKDLGLQGASSVGTGLRFIVPRVHRFVLRADIAKGLKKKDGWGVSIGMNQFFQPDSLLQE